LLHRGGELAVVLIIVTLTNSRGAIVMTVIGFAAILVHLILIEHPAAYTNAFPRGGSILMFCALAIIGQLYPATILARLVTLELEHRRG
jgi:hypothetical protein